MAQFTDDQFQQFMAMMRGNNPPPPANDAPPAVAPAPRNDPSALGPMAPCSLGTNKMTKLTKFEEWLSAFVFPVVTNQIQKLKYQFY